MNDLEYNEDYYKELASKWIKGTITNEEEVRFSSWYNQEVNREITIPEEFVVNEAEHRNRMLAEINKRIGVSKKVQLWPRLVAAALIGVLFISGFYLMIRSFTKDEAAIAVLKKHDIPAGKNKAVLTLANGEVLSLSDLAVGEHSQHDGAIITKNRDGQLQYQVVDTENNSNEIAYNTISTPKGGQYQVNLPDGTKIWLNSASSLKFPTSFKKLFERKVELAGEGYFEVAKDKSRPFRVVSNQQTVTVYGTHFNINAYSDEAEMVTTLIEGSVDVNHVLLRPNEQSVIKDNQIKVQPADIESVIAWKNGYFRFEEERLDVIMKKVSRWYDVDIEFADPALKELEFGVVTSRSGNLSGILKMLEMTHEIYFTLNGRKITVLNYTKENNAR
ncbi:FecR family protein [Pedobacter sp. HDW13]|uniref:FecR family protein n=1 Tax=unclassified Pedobacter TaxID=2628915 RepID=UPI000F5B3333|nr:MULTISPECIES: FecR domain-containing protein [unclassified Pedobacter]QIL41556.1 FecR family protein [Pedobacter sp. HDW13]RQO77869.1 hypothetical protein DBR40_07835 [Pedobacter sp. KBW01]